ncbi:MAG: hypothetical protein ACRCW1_05370 [Anaerotignaceae bacterium]
MNNKICSFFGHRDTREMVWEDLYNEVIKVIKYDGVTKFYVGNNGTFDSLALQAVGQAKNQFPNIEIYVILAYMPTKKEQGVKANCDGTIYPEGLEFVPKRFAISHRNRWIVQQSYVVIGYVKTAYGGAYEALHYAKNQEKKVINLGEK